MMDFNAVTVLAPVIRVESGQILFRDSMAA